MSVKAKKSNSWFQCGKCQATIIHKDLENHEKNCPPSKDIFIHPFVLSGCLNGPLEIKSNEEIKGLDYHEKNNLVFLSQSVIQLCNLVIGEWAIVNTVNYTVTPSAKIVWPTTEKSLSSVLVTQAAYDLYWKGKTDVKVSIKKLITSNCKTAKKVFIILLNPPKTLKVNQEIISRLKKLYVGRFLTGNNKLSCMFYGKNLEFLIGFITPVENGEAVEESTGNVVKNLQTEFDNLSLDTKHFYKITNSTIFSAHGDADDISISKQINPLSAIGGYEAEILEIQELLDVATGRVKGVSGINSTRGVLLYGPSGCGKTMIADAIAEMSNCKVFSINGTEIYGKYSGEIDMAIGNIFRDASDQAPSVILLDEFDVLCPPRSSRISDQEKRNVSNILRQMDLLQKTGNCKVFIIATSNKPDMIATTFRRCGRLDREIEISIPNPEIRLKILKKLLLKSNCNLSDADLKMIADLTHGFVGSDLTSLVARAAMNSIKRCATIAPEIILDDLKSGLGRVLPSAMREIQVEIPNVKWSDIGGQHNLKLILKQAVEWPLKHPESFVRMGITPPRGVLMYGPPGCSKTMIAKALATESGLNFISIKGPELFSKWVGESERAVRDVFKKARQVSPSIIFFDEIDALGSERSSGAASGGTSVQERVLAQLLTELDGVSPLGDVTILAATNRPDRIDKALLRPGRLDRIVYVPLPDEGTRKEIFDLKLAKMPIFNVNTDDLVARTENYSGAEIQAVCHEAAMKALESNINALNVTWEHFLKALEIIKPRTHQSMLNIYEEYAKTKL